MPGRSAVVDDPKRKTKIKITANMNDDAVQKYLTKALKSCLLVEKSNFCELTDKGKMFLDEYAEFKRLDELVVSGP